MTYVGHWVGLFVSWVTSVRNLFLSVCWGGGDLCWALGLSVCWLRDFCRALGLFLCWVGELCWALGLSVCWWRDLCLVMFGLFGTSIAD